ncbi:jg10268, partial [Pararge aegeria aegeria]
GPVIIASSQGGVNIEDVAAENPDAITYEPIDIKSGITDEQVSRVVEKIGLEDNKEEACGMIKKMYDLFLKKDALLIEINPYAEDALTGKFIIASSQGGVNIEDVAAENPDAITYEPIDIKSGITDEQVSRVVEKIGLEDNKEEACGMIKKMYDLFLKKDALLIEINPYAEDALTGKCEYYSPIYYITQ